MNATIQVMDQSTGGIREIQVEAWRVGRLWVHKDLNYPAWVISCPKTGMIVLSTIAKRGTAKAIAIELSERLGKTGYDSQESQDDIRDSFVSIGIREFFSFDIRDCPVGKIKQMLAGMKK